MNPAAALALAVPSEPIAGTQPIELVLATQ